MNTFLKIVGVIALLLVVGHFWPIALFPFSLAAIALLLCGSLLAALIALVVGIAVVALIPVAAVVLALAAALSPAWVPLLIVLIIVGLCRRGRATA